MTSQAPPVAVVEEELDRLFDSAALRRAPSHMRLLRYLVERRLAGDEAALRETSIALEVFRRDPATYDPQTDPIVRVTIGRLRGRLAAHYAHYDAPPKIRIVLPKGRYAPEFVTGDAVRARHGLAVLPARNLTGDAGREAFCAAFSDRVADNLARAGVARVVAPTSARAAQSHGSESEGVAAELGVQWLIECVLAREQAGEERLSVRLMLAVDGSMSWIETGVARGDGVYALADRIVDAVVLRMCTSGASLPSASADGTTVRLATAQRNALDNARLLLLRRTVAATDQAILLAEGVVTAAPSAAAGWAALASALYSRLSFQDQDHGPLLGRAEVSADRALALDPDEPVALRTKAIIVGKCAYRPAAAEPFFARALRNAPHYTSARLNYAEILWLQGRFDEALAETSLALVYDPLSSSVRMARAMCLGIARRHDEARVEWDLCRAAGDSSAWLLTESGLNDLLAGHQAEGEALLDEAIARYPELPGVAWYRIYGWCTRGDVARARAEIEACRQRFPKFSPTTRATLAAMLRDRQAVLENLATAYAMRDVAFLYAAVAPQFEWLASDTAFRRILKRAGISGWCGRATTATP
ncbi:MAG: tetratricopeptide repeat protein [Casimicrobiaceae bacterium]